MKAADTKITYFTKEELSGIPLPEKFTFPFFYEPHPLSIKAAQALQDYLEHSTDLDHNFGLSKDSESLVIGKMFGVLVVQDGEGRTGYLSGVSGKLGGSNEHRLFVPPVFDMLAENSFFLKEQYILNDLNNRVTAIEADAAYIRLCEAHSEAKGEAASEIEAFRQQLRENKSQRKQLRTLQKATLSHEEYAALEAHLVRHSLHDKHQLRLLEEKWATKLQRLEERLAPYQTRIELLKKERRDKSAALQEQLFEQYTFLNRHGEPKSLQSIFKDTVFARPPAAAGECATPKLLQYAFRNGYTPLAMAEFWWGAAPKSEVRKHKQFYPACTGKCKPILEHMLEGIAIEDNPLLHNPGENKKLAIVYEDDSFVVVNKPADLLSVPGIAIHDCVYTRIKYLWEDVEPLIIHRLDMATSGLLVVAKTKEAHKDIQKQFLKRTVTKRYMAVLSGHLAGNEGEINLPLRGDPDNRPRQLVCFEYGKYAVTKWQVLEKTATTTKVHFWPVTGRTHQLRMHAAHELGLNTPIVGDDLYGTPAERLFLHAGYLELVHPVTRQTMVFETEAGF